MYNPNYLFVSFQKLEFKSLEEFKRTADEADYYWEKPPVKNNVILHFEFFSKLVE